MTPERKLKLVSARLRLAESKIVALEALAGIGTGKRVFGADIYVQDTEPTASGDWVWIDTNGIDLITT